jgi:hypothetical protein
MGSPRLALDAHRQVPRAASRYCDIFPRHKIHVFLFDDMQRSPEDVVHAMYQFLAVDSTFRTGFRYAS